MRYEQTITINYGLRLAAITVLMPIFLLLPTQYSAAQSSKRVIFALSTKDSSTAPILTAAHLGYFKDEGIDANIVLMRSDIGVKALITGDVDFAASVSSVIKASAAKPANIPKPYANEPKYCLNQPRTTGKRKPPTPPAAPTTPVIDPTRFANRCGTS